MPGEGTCLIWVLSRVEGSDEDSCREILLGAGVTIERLPTLLHRLMDCRDCVGGVEPCRLLREAEELVSYLLEVRRDHLIRLYD